MGKNNVEPLRGGRRRRRSGDLRFLLGGREKEETKKGGGEAAPPFFRPVITEAGLPDTSGGKKRTRWGRQLIMRCLTSFFFCFGVQRGKILQQTG